VPTPTPAPPLAAGGLTAETVQTPGHSPGCQCLWFADAKLLLSGDTLFAGAIGGTTFLEAYEEERQHIREKLFPRGDATRVYPAHGPATTIGVERRCNPFLR